MDTPVALAPQLALDPIVSRLPLDRPFTPAQAAAAGVSRTAVERMQRTGQVRRLVRGVYANASAPDDLAFRAQVVALAAGGDLVAVDRTACWVHGISVDLLSKDGEVPLELARTRGRGRGTHRSLAPFDIECHEGARVSTRLRTALDVGRLLPPGIALACLDRLMTDGSFTHTQLLASLARMGGLEGIAQLRVVASLVDTRACCAAESLLRWHWNTARVPTAIPAMTVVASGRLVRLSIGTEHRRFGAVLAGHVDAEDLLALEAADWWIVVLPEKRVLEVDQATLTGHLQREFHQHLLAEVEAG